MYEFNFVYFILFISTNIFVNVASNLLSQQISSHLLSGNENEISIHLYFHFSNENEISVHDDLK